MSLPFHIQQLAGTSTIAGVAAPRDDDPMSLSNIFGLTATQRLYGFGICFVAGFVISFLSLLSLGTGNIAGFAVLYTLGNVVSLLSTMFLVGPVRQFKMAFAPVRLVATIIYLASMIVTLIVAIKTSKVVLCVIFIIIQICAMVWYAASYIPYGRALIRKVVGNAVNM